MPHTEVHFPSDPGTVCAPCWASPRPGQGHGACLSSANRRLPASGPRAVPMLLLVQQELGGGAARWSGVRGARPGVCKPGTARGAWPASSCAPPGAARPHRSGPSPWSSLCQQGHTEDTASPSRVPRTGILHPGSQQTPGREGRRLPQPAPLPHAGRGGCTGWRRRSPASEEGSAGLRKNEETLRTLRPQARHDGFLRGSEGRGQGRRRARDGRAP